jgi:hypothetical protein
VGTTVACLPPLHEFIPLSGVPAALPKQSNGKPISKNRVYAAVKGGLRTIELFGRKHTHPTWLLEFFNGGHLPAASRTTKTRQRAAAAANRQLEAMGL